MIIILLKIIIFITYFSLFLGWAFSVYDALKVRQYKKGILNFIIPFYCFHYILKLPETNKKKIMAIMTLGAFVLFFFCTIALTILTPPL